MFALDPGIPQDRSAMQLMVSPNCPAIDAQAHTEYLAHDARFRIADGPYCLHTASKGQIESEERIILLDCRNALAWLNGMPDAPRSYWHFAESANQRYRRQNVASPTSKANRG
jgi:hypothetical protein